MEQEKQQWFAMRDLKRPNAKLRAYEMLKDKVERVYTPMVKKTLMRNGKRCLVDVPYIPDLLFVYDSKSVIDPIVSSVPTFQYRFVRSSTPHRGGDRGRYQRQGDGAVHPSHREYREVPLLHPRRGLPVDVWQEDMYRRRQS